MHTPCPRAGLARVLGENAPVMRPTHFGTSAQCRVVEASVAAGTFT